MKKPQLTLLIVLLAVASTIVSPIIAEEKAARPHIVFVIGEREYETHTTLPAFAKKELIPLGFKCTFIHADEKDKHDFPGLDALRNADLMVLSVRRRSLPEVQLAMIRTYLKSGRPIVGIRTASHAFHTKGKHPAGHAEWTKFDPEVLGGNYTGHHGNSKTTMMSRLDGVKHPILVGVSTTAFHVGGSLYKVRPLSKTCHPLLMGRIDNAEAEPVAWTNKYKNSRVFYTSLGHPDDFKIKAFRVVLVNAIKWGLDRDK